MESLPVFLSGLLLVLLFTSFVKIATTLSILRYGIGLEGAGFGIVILGAALVLSLLVMQPQLGDLGGWDRVLMPQAPLERTKVEASLLPFLEKHARPALVERFSALSAQLKKDGGQETKTAGAAERFPVLGAAFLIGELGDAFRFGLLFIIPFVVIDLLVTNILSALGVTQMPHRVVALPLKLLLFLAVDGWALVSEKLLGSYL